MNAGRPRVRVLAVGDPAVYGYTDPAESILAPFTERTGIPVDFEIKPWDDYGAVLFAEAASDQPAYDIVMVAGHLWLAQFVDAGWLAPVDQLVAADVLPQIVAELSYRGRRWLVPSFTDGHIVYDRSDDPRLIDATGLTDPLAVAALAADGVRVVCKAAPSEIFLDWVPYLWSLGGSWIAEDGEPLFDSAEGREALERYLTLRSHMDARFSPWGNEEVAQALRSGSAQIGISWGGQAGVIVPDAARNRATPGSYEAGDKPAANNDPFRYATLTHPWNVTWSFGLLARAAHPTEASELLAHLGGPEADTMIARRAGSPVRAATYTDDTIVAACPWLSAQHRLVERARTFPPRADLAALMGPMYEHLSIAWTGEQTAAEALARAAKQIRTVLRDGSLG